MPSGSLGAVPNFSLTNASDGNVTLRWDPATGTAGIVPQYEVVELRSTDPCSVFFSQQNVIATTTATSFTFKPSQSLGLIEAAGQTVTVKATLRSQILIPGGLASAPLSATKEYTLAPRQSIVISDLARAIFGAGRDTLGDIQEMQLEVAVTGGEGGVVAYTLATENATDDTALRME